MRFLSVTTNLNKGFFNTLGYCWYLNFGVLPTPSYLFGYGVSPRATFLFWPHGELYSVCKSSKFSEHSLRILRSMCRLAGSALDNHSELEYETSENDLMGMPSATTDTRKGTERDLIYESCRLAALIMVQALDANTPFINISVSPVDQLKLAMQ